MAEVWPDVPQYFIYPGSAPPNWDLESFFLCTPDETNCLTADHFDLTVNIDSFQEMTEPQVRFYIDLAQQLAKENGLFLNINRRKLLGRESWDNNPLMYPYLKQNLVLEWEVDPYYFAVNNHLHRRIDGCIRRVELIREAET